MEKETNSKTKDHCERRKKKSVRTIISNVVLVIAVAVFLFSGYKLFTIYFEYSKGEEEYEGVVEAVIHEERVEHDEADAEEEVVFKVDFEKLLSINDETVAWIRFVEPSKISYPVVQGIDNSKYLSITFEGQHNGAGCLFVDVANTSDFSDRNTFIYGHNMKNGSMFGQLRNYKTKSFYEENPYFYLYTPDGKEVQYQVFAVCIVEDTADSFRKFYADDEDYLKYITHIQSLSLYDTGVEVQADSKIVSLSTCTNVSETQRLLVHGVKIAETMQEEKAEPTTETVETENAMEDAAEAEDVMEE